MSTGVAIIGAGLIGRKRAEVLSISDNCRLTAVADINCDAAEKLTNEFGGKAEPDWQRIVERDDTDIVIVSTVNKFLAPISVAAAKNGKHILCEKPLGRNPKESKQIIEAAIDSGVIVKTGFNHRHHPAIAKAKQLASNGKIGKLYVVRCRYGHGGRPGYDKEWRANKDLCGGGELLDQGVHVVDLFRWFAGDFDEVFGHTQTCFWNMPVEDNAFALFKSKDGITASMHTSWTQWKNLFSFEVFGSDGYLIIEGLGGSYGTETLRIGKRKPQSGPPDEEILEFPGPDISWEDEWRAFITAIEDNKDPIGNGWDGYQANRMIDAVYQSVRTKGLVKL